MKGILVICIIIIFGLGFIVMHKIDKFLELPNVFKDEGEKRDTGKAFALVFGCSQIANNLILLLESHGIGYQQIEDENQFDRLSSYSHLFAISESDLDNMMISVIVNRRLQIKDKIAICNYLENKKIFEQNNINYLCGDNITADTLFNCMFSYIEKPKEISNAQ